MALSLRNTGNSPLDFQQGNLKNWKTRNIGTLTFRWLISVLSLVVVQF